VRRNWISRESKSPLIGMIEKESGGFRFTKISLKPVAIIFAEHERERAQRLLEKAQKLCLVARSLSCAIQLEPKILAETPVAV
jgi:organic hydroperoxide reductase OsmC/OhrA